MLKIGQEVKLKDSNTFGIVSAAFDGNRYEVLSDGNTTEVSLKDISVVARSQARQGDVLFTRIDVLPSGAVRTNPEKDPLVVGHSETGHHHVVNNMEAHLFKLDSNPNVCYLKSSDLHIDVDHLRIWDTHTSLCLLSPPGSIWEVTQQEEYTPAGWRKVVD